MTNNEALLIALRAALKRWQSAATVADYKTGQMPLAVLTHNEMAAVRKFWPDARGTEGNSILPNVLQAAIRQLAKPVHHVMDKTKEKNDG